MTTLTLDEVKIMRRGYSMPKAVDDARNIPDFDDGHDVTFHRGDEFTDDNANDDEIFDR